MTADLQAATELNQRVQQLLQQGTSLLLEEVRFLLPCDGLSTCMLPLILLFVVLNSMELIDLACLGVPSVAYASISLCVRGPVLGCLQNGVIDSAMQNQKQDQRRYQEEHPRQSRQDTTIVQLQHPSAVCPYTVTAARRAQLRLQSAQWKQGSSRCWQAACILFTTPAWTSTPAWEVRGDCMPEEVMNALPWQL